MVQKHSRTGVTHDLLYFLFHIWLIAVDSAFAARCFIFLKGAIIEAELGVFEEFNAFRAQFIICIVLCFAIDLYHIADGFLLSLNSWMFLKSHGNFTSGFS